MDDSLIGPERIIARLEGAPPKTLIVLVGPSGVGKGSISRRLLLNPVVHRVTTYTTRSPRPGEAELGQYRFVSRQTFLAKYEAGQILEKVDVYGQGHLYGLPADMMTNTPPGKRVVLAEVDVNGKIFLDELFPDNVSIFLTAPPEELRARIISRAGEEGIGEEELRQRMETARQQMQQAGSFDYIVFNEEGRLEETVAQLEAIITAARLRTRPGVDLPALFAAEAEE